MSTTNLQELSPQVRAELEQIFKNRLPIEACGILLPSPHRGKLVWEMPNRSMTAHRSFKMSSSDVRLEINPWILENVSRLHEVTFWHTHPSGDPTPSKSDIDNRVSQACNLVVTVNDQGLQASWY